jgi:hypothetical protein
MKLVAADVYFRSHKRQMEPHEATEGERTTAGGSYGRRINIYAWELMISSYHYDYKWVAMIIMKM